jgi:curved DNA-binding protein CbpA
MDAVVTKLTPEELKACKDFGFDTVVHHTDVKKRYRELALEHHPDRGGDPERFKEIASSYEVLMKVTPVDCSQHENREFELTHSWIFGDFRRETEASKTRRYSKYAPDGFTEWREHL